MKKKQEESFRFELVVQLKDHNGKPTGKTKTLQTNNVCDLEGFWRKWGVVHKKKGKKESVPSANEAQQILSSMYDDED